MCRSSVCALIWAHDVCRTEFVSGEPWLQHGGSGRLSGGCQMVTINAFVIQEEVANEMMSSLW